jgi:hypothetical protein
MVELGTGDHPGTVLPVAFKKLPSLEFKHTAHFFENGNVRLKFLSFAIAVRSHYLCS